MCPHGRDSGHAVVEVLLLGLLLLVPIVWMLTVFAELHAAALGTTSAAREAGFEAARAVDASTADAEVLSLVEASMVDHGLDPGSAQVSWTPGSDWRRGATIEILVSYTVPVFQAPFLGEITEPGISVTAKHIATIDRYRSRAR